MAHYRKTHIFPQSGGFYYKRHVPHDLRGTIGRKAWTKWLGTVSRPEAEFEGRTLGLEHDKLIKRLRGMSADDRAYLAKVGYDHLPQMVENLEKAGNIYEEIGRVVSPDHFSAVEMQGRAALLVLRGQRGVRETRADIAKAKSFIGGSDDADKLIAVWREAAKPRQESTVKSMRRYLDRFKEHLGRGDVLKVTKAEVIAYRDALESRADLGHKSRQKHLDALSRLYTVAMGENLIEFNPAHKVKARKPDGGKFADDDSQGKAFEPKHVEIIFDNLDGEHDDIQWVTRLLAYHGARSGEICQLRVEDVTTLFGVPVLRIHDRYGSIKNKHSKRDVPIHPACMGIVEYAKAAKGPWLFASFPDWHSRAGKYQRWGSTFLREKCKILDTDLTMHSLRHMWRTLAREIGMPPAVSRSIMGHKLGTDDHEEYGGPPSLKLRAKWIKKIHPLGG